jgi:hypothetical protein
VVINKRGEEILFLLKCPNSAGIGLVPGLEVERGRSASNEGGAGGIGGGVIMVKRALLVGCNYPGTQCELKGCVNDVDRMRVLLVQRFGFHNDEILQLVDDDPSSRQPTGANIRQCLVKLIQGVRPGDAIVFHFSGHGTQVLNSLLRTSFFFSCLHKETQTQRQERDAERRRETEKETEKGTQRE